MRIAFYFAIFLLGSVPYALSQSFGVYSLTMTTPNYLNVFSGNLPNGELTFVEAVATGGNGTGVQSQSAVFVWSNYIFAVNPLSNSLSLFWIDPQEPTFVKLVGSPIYTEGDFPDTVTANAFAACVANTGANSGIACFTFNKSNGLSLIRPSIRSLALSLTTPPGNHLGPGQISFTPDNTGLVLVVKGRNPPVYLYPASYPGNVLSLAQTPATSGPKGVDNFAFAFDSSAMVVADTSPYGNGSGVIVVTVDTKGLGSVAFGTPNYFLLPNLKGSCWIEYSPLTNHFYVANAGSGVITELVRSDVRLSIVDEIQMTSASGPVDLTIIQNYLFVNNPPLNQIWVLQFGRSSGGTWVQKISNFGSTSGMAGYLVQEVTPTSSSCLSSFGH